MADHSRAVNRVAVASAYLAARSCLTHRRPSRSKSCSCSSSFIGLVTNTILLSAASGPVHRPVANTRPDAHGRGVLFPRYDPRLRKGERLLATAVSAYMDHRVPTGCRRDIRCVLRSTLGRHYRRFMTRPGPKPLLKKLMAGAVLAIREGRRRSPPATTRRQWKPRGHKAAGRSPEWLLGQP